jgi:hypothetical protein
MLVVMRVRAGVAIRLPIAIVNKYRRIARQHIVRVKIVDGEVVDGGVLCRPAVDRGDLDVGTGAGFEPLAGLEIGGVDPFTELGDPEGVSVSGGDSGRFRALVAVDVNGDLDQVFDALTLDLGGDGFDRRFTGLRAVP